MKEKRIDDVALDRTVGILPASSSVPVLFHGLSKVGRGGHFSHVRMLLGLTWHLMVRISIVVGLSIKNLNLLKLKFLIIRKISMNFTPMSVSLALRLTI